MTKRRVEPLVWLMFSAGGVLAAVFLPVLIALFGLAFPLDIVSAPDFDHMQAVVTHPLTRLVLLGLLVLMLVHAAHRFRYTLYDGLQLKSLKTPIAVLCYGAALAGSVVSLLVVLTV